MAKIRSFTSDIDVKIREETYLDWFHDWFASWHLNNNGPPLSSFWSTRPKSTREPSRVPWKIVGRTRPEQSRSDNDGPDYVWIAHVTMNPTACRADACKMRPLPRAVPDQITLSKATDDWSNPRDQPAARRMPADLWNPRNHLHRILPTVFHDWYCSAALC